MIELPEVKGLDTSGIIHISTEKSTFDDTATASSYRSRAVKVLTAAACVASVSFFASSALLKQTSQPSFNGTNRTKRVTDTLSSSAPHFDLRTHEPLKFHQSGFGALNFHHHEDGSNLSRRYLEATSVQVPKSAVPTAIQSIAEPNVINLHGHYLHDEHRSPFASPKYDRPNEELEQEQKEYIEKMEKVREEWGFWSFKDDANIVRPIQDFSKIAYKDIKNTDWQKNVWQTDEKYVKDLIAEGRKLVDRMIDAIHVEYGFPKSGATMTSEEEAAKEEAFKLHLLEKFDSEVPRSSKTGSGYLSNDAYDALARKLLHGMITNDEFYYVQGGHSAAAGHGNNFLQQKTMALSYIIEPVFHKLGMRFIARNLGMGGYGTAHFNGGQGTLYGESDILEWDSAMTEKGEAAISLFNRQGILTGERVPILLTSQPFNINDETGGKAWLGDLISSTEGFSKVTSLEQGKTMPWALQYLACESDVANLCGGRGIDKYNSVCWVDRKDIEVDPSMKTRNVGGAASWHPGWRTHQLHSRKSAIMILYAFKKAFDVWEEGMEKDGFPLNEKYWHVGSIYKDIKDTLSENVTKDSEEDACQKHLKTFEIQKICYLPMNGMTTFTPKNIDYDNSILKYAVKGANGHPKIPVKTLYKGPNLVPLSWKIPSGDVDVHAVAVASNYEASQIDHFWENLGDDDDVEEDAEAERRLGQVDEAEERILSTTGIVPGEGWGVSTLTQGKDDYCDGSQMSECNRSAQSNCLLGGTNDGRQTISGNGESGWLVINVPNVKKGYILAKMEWWHPHGGWVLPTDETVRKLNEDGGNNVTRNMGGRVVPLPDDFKFDIAVNGKITTWDLETFMKYTKEFTYNEAFYPLLDDESVTGDVELAIRIRSESDPKTAGLSVAHIYWS